MCKNIGEKINNNFNMALSNLVAKADITIYVSPSNQKIVLHYL